MQVWTEGAESDSTDQAKFQFNSGCSEEITAHLRTSSDSNSISTSRLCRIQIAIGFPIRSRTPGSGAGKDHLICKSSSTIRAAETSDTSGAYYTNFYVYFTGSGLTSNMRRFWNSTSANVATIFALAALPLMGAIGAAVDYSRASVQHARLQSASDAATIAGVVAAKASLDSGSNRKTALAAADSTSAAHFRANFGPGASYSATFSLNGLQISGAGSANFANPTTVMAMFGFDSTPLAVQSRTSASVEPFLNIYLLIDISASMLLPATSEGVTRMQSGTGCALACHDKTDGTDTYAWANRNNILMRYQVVNQGIQNLVSYIQSRPTLSNKVRIELWSFDHDMRRLVSLTSNLARITANFPAPALAVNEESAATRFDDFVGTFVSAVGVSGSGSSRSDAKKLVMIATDGVNDPTRAWTWNTALRSQVRAIDPAFCTTLKSRGNTVAVINTPYLPMTWDWGYNATLGQPGNRGGLTRVDDVPIVLKQCAGSYFTAASDVDAIRASFVTLFTAASVVRLSQ